MSNTIITIVIVSGAGANITNETHDLCNPGVLQVLLSFAVGGLLADVFLHLLPEAWTAALHGGREGGA